MGKDVEIELKFPLKNSVEVFAFLNTNASLKDKDNFQRDVYFTPAHRDFLSVKYPFEWLRLRESANGVSLDYKHFYPENVNKTDYCDEFRTKVDDAGKLRKIFSSLGFKEVAVVEKNRSTWVFKEVEIAIDDVKDLGLFIELEAVGDFADPKDGKEYLYSVLRLLNASVGSEDLRGYPFRILEKKGYKFGE